MKHIYFLPLSNACGRSETHVEDQKKTVDNGKRYARKRKTTLSKVIEKYLDRIATEEPSEITPLVKSLSGVVKPTSTADKSSYASFLAKKYR